MKKAIGWMTAALFGGMVLFSMANNAQGVLLSSFIDTFALTSSWQGVPNAAANAGVFMAMLLAVPMAARVGKLRLYTGGVGLMGVMLLLAGAAPSGLLLVAAYLVMGFAFGCVDTCASALVADLHQGERGTMLMGALHAGYGAGGILAPILMTAALSAGMSWRWVLWALAMVAGIAFLFSVIVFTRGRDSLPATAAPPQKLSRSDIKLFFQKPGNLWLVLCTACYCAHQCSIYLWISRIMEVRYHTLTLGATALSLFWVGTVCSRLLVPLLRIKAAPYLRYGVLLAAALLCVGIAADSAVALCAVAALCGLVGGAVLPMAISEGTRRNPTMSMLAVTALLLTTGLAAMICAPLIGFIVSKTALTGALVVSAVFAGLSGLCARGVRE